jgi:tRNA U34 5-carboxymethylaminomethyl modifying enzyme MnmG/GidA
MEGITLVCIPSLILHKLNRDFTAQMSCNPAIGGIPFGAAREHNLP